MPDIDRLSRLLTRRSDPLLDVGGDSALAPVASSISGCQALVIGGAGSIGSAVATELCRLGAGALHIVDIDENGLANLVRDLRSGAFDLPASFRTSVVDFGSPGFARLLASEAPFDVVLNLSALKHVRSERDAFTLQRMIEVNVMNVAALAEQLSGRGSGRLFSVSSDKAVYPANLMGATKRWMEKVVAGAGGTSARFANVAFSKGALPQAVLQRLERNEPIAAPMGVERYFITHQEAAHICLVSAFGGRPGEVVAPGLSASEHAVSMTDMVAMILSERGLEPRLCETEAEAKALAADRPADAAWWPCLFEQVDTAGEKELEEFFYPDEAVDRSRHPGIAFAGPVRPEPDALRAASDLYRDAVAAPVWKREAFADAIGRAVSELAYAAAAKSLDDRM